MPDNLPVTVQITPEALAITWQTLMAVARNYDMGTESQACLIEARRLVEVEVRLQHGDDAWQEMIAGSLTRGDEYCMGAVGNLSGSAPEMCSLLVDHPGRCTP